MNLRLAAVTAAALLAASAAPAWAHVTIHSSEAVRGGKDGVVAIRVPNEEDQATTTRVEVDFPATNPLIGVLVQPTPGWQFQATTSKLPTPVTTDDGQITDYVSKIVWSGGSIPVGGFQDFDIDVSSFPDVPSVTLLTLQTYSNGDIVRWIDPPPPPGGTDPQHPAPLLTLSAANAAPASGTAPATTPSAQVKPATASDTTATVLAVVALVVAMIGTGVAAVALRKERRAG